MKTEKREIAMKPNKLVLETVKKVSKILNLENVNVVVDDYNVPIMRIYRYLKHGIKNLVYWFPIIWQDRNFDHYYLSAILRHKLNDMEKFYNSPYAWGVNAAKLAHEMKVCVIILDRIIEDDYNREGYDAHDKKWGELTFERGALGNMLLKRSKRVTKEEEEIEQKEYSEVYKKEEEDREKDIETLFDIIRKNIRNWWD